MSSANIQAEVQAGLAEAKRELGSASSPTVYLEQKTVTGGDSPLTPATVTTNNVELINALFKSVSRGLVDNSLVFATDSQLVCSNQVSIKQGDIILQGSKRWVVVLVTDSAPFGDVLVQRPVVRLQ